MRIFASTCLAAVLCVAGPTLASDHEFDGDWWGKGYAEAGDCPGFDFIVSVSGSAVEGVASQTGGEYRIVGEVTQDGRFTGEVEYLWFTIAELTGDIETEKGEGAWRTVEGPECAGIFTVHKN